MEQIGKLETFNTKRNKGVRDMARLIMFAILAVVILASAIFCVSTKRIMRAATALLFVLFGVAGLYFPLDYTFLVLPR